MGTTFTDVDTLCLKEQEENPESQLASLCSCRQALKGNTTILKNYINQSSNYEQMVNNYNEYLKRMTKWTNYYNGYEDSLRSFREDTNCGKVGWDDSSRQKCHQKGMDTDIAKQSRYNCDGLVDVCKYTQAYITQKLNQYKGLNPKPPRVAEPILPGQIGLANVVCCDQNFQNIQAGSVEFNNIVQKCQFNINQRIADEVQKMSRNDSSPVSSPVFTPSSTPFSTPSPDVNDFWSKNQGWLIPVIILVVILLCVVGYYAFR